MNSSTQWRCPHGWLHGVQCPHCAQCKEMRDKIIALEKTIAALMLAPPAQPDWLLSTTQALAKSIALRCYQDVPQFEVLDDLPGVISQIDNMTTGMERKAPPAQPLMSDEDFKQLCEQHHAESMAEWAQPTHSDRPPDVYWQPIATAPHGVKIQLLSKGGVAIYGSYHGGEFWVGWYPLPKKQASICENHPTYPDASDHADK